VFADSCVYSLTSRETDQKVIERNFHEVVKSWDNILKEELLHDIHRASADILRQAKLLEHWFTKWCLSLQDDSKRATFVQLNAGQFTKDEDV